MFLQLLFPQRQDFGWGAPDCTRRRVPLEPPLSQTPSRDGVGVCASHTPAGFTWFAEATRHKSVWRQSRRCCACVYSSPAARGVSLRIQAASVAALSADRRIGVTKQRGDWHPSRPLQARRLTLYTSPDALNSSPQRNCLAWSSSEACSVFWLEFCQSAEVMFFYVVLGKIFK